MKWLNTAVCKTVIRGFEPHRFLHFYNKKYMKKIFKKFKNLFHFHREKPYKRVLMILMPVLIAVLIIVATQNRVALANAISWAGDKIESQFHKKNQSSYLKYDKAVFARVTEKEGVIFLDKGIYERGEPVHFALMNVGKFKRDKEGKNWVDMDILIKDPAGNVAMKKEHMLGEGGHLKLDNDTAPSPDGVYVPAGNVKLGKYKVSIRVYDRIGGGEVSDSGTFELIKQKIPPVTTAPGATTPPATNPTTPPASNTPDTTTKTDPATQGNTPVAN